VRIQDGLHYIEHPLGDEALSQVVDWQFERSGIVSLVNPQAVVLGGSVGSQADVLLARVREVVDRWCHLSARSVTLTCSELGVGAGLLGAAYATFVRSEGERPWGTKGEVI
jgi:hypothetical protein